MYPTIGSMFGGRVDVPPVHQTDESLIEQIAGRDTSALEMLYDRHAQIVYNLILRIVRDESLADEVLHDTFWLVWQNAHTFRAGGAAAAWIYRIARNRSLDELRRLKSRPQTVPTDSDADQEQVIVDTTVPSVEDQAEHQWRRHHLRQILSEIPTEQRQCLELAYFDGMSQREIATHMGTPLGTVKTRMRIGLDKLQHILRSAGWKAEDV